MAIEIVAAKKEKLADENAVREALAKLRPEKNIESVSDKGDSWLVRLADKPPFLEDKDAPSDPDGDGDDDSSPETDTDDDGGSEKSDKKPFGDKEDGDKPKGDVASELKDLIGQLQDVLKQVTDKAGDAVSEVEEHRDKLDKAKDALGEGEGPIPGDIGPTPGGPAGGPGVESVPAPGGLPGGPGAKPAVPRRPGVPTGRGPAGMRPGAPTTFSKRQTEIVTHAGVNDSGQALTLLEAANALESDPEWGDYKIVGMTENRDGSFSAKLRLR